MFKKLSRKANKLRELEGNWGGQRPVLSMPGPSQMPWFSKTAQK